MLTNRRVVTAEEVGGRLGCMPFKGFCLPLGRPKHRTVRHFQLQQLSAATTSACSGQHKDPCWVRYLCMCVFKPKRSHRAQFWLNFNGFPEQGANLDALKMAPSKLPPEALDDLKVRAPAPRLRISHSGSGCAQSINQ